MTFFLYDTFFQTDTKIEVQVGRREEIEKCLLYEGLELTDYVSVFNLIFLLCVNVLLKAFSIDLADE